jgi:spermidine synthase
MEELFDVSKMYLVPVPLYPAGLWSFMIGSRIEDPLSQDTLNRVKNGLKTFGVDLKYYNSRVHKACFALPNFVSDIICNR